jgi:hypothetical protein
MRLSELLGAEVVDQHGRSAGRVQDVRFQQDGPMVGSFGASLRVAGLIVGRASFGSRLGFDTGDVRGPLLVKLLVGWVGRDRRYVAWDRVVEVEVEAGRVGGSVDELRPPERAS